MLTVPETVALFAGAEIETVGAVVSDAAVTVTLVEAEVVPPVPVQDRLYVEVVVGLTDAVPEIALVPLQLPDAVQEVASVELQVKVEDEPLVIEVGADDKVTVDAGVGAGGGTGVGVAPTLTWKT